ncbi:MAG: hypothetical protein INQ03_12385 [Candidatus Heimdallarchaeota archaeon]|nr:hypothetical protein [Candidatus Heimdallarchaeota archaeon]
MSKEFDEEEKIGDKLGKYAKKGLKTGVKIGIKAGAAVKEAIEESKFEREESEKISPIQQESTGKFERREMSPYPTTGIDSVDRQIQIWKGWFYSTIFYLMLIIIMFMIGSIEPRFKIIAWLLLLGFPFFLFKAIVNSIPEIKIGNRVIFSRKDISMRDQLTFTSTVFRTISRDMYRTNPMFTFILLLFLIIFIVVVLAPFFT